jgi:hypothetical protein
MARLDGGGPWPDWPPPGSATASYVDQSHAYTFSVAGILKFL